MNQLKEMNARRHIRLLFCDTLPLLKYGSPPLGQREIKQTATHPKQLAARSWKYRSCHSGEACYRNAIRGSSGWLVGHHTAFHPSAHLSVLSFETQPGRRPSIQKVWRDGDGRQFEGVRLFLS